MESLKRRLSEQFELGKNFLKNIKSGDRVLVVYHVDVDGMCSGALFLSAFKKLGITASSMPGMIEEPEKIFAAIKDFDKVVIVDVAIDHLHEQLKQSGKPILFLDHHPQFTDMNSEVIVHINPHFEKDVYQPAAYIAYKFLSEIVDLQAAEWVAVLGTLGDYGFEDCKDLVGKWVNIKERGEIWDTDFGKTAIKIGGASFETGTEKIVDILLQANSLDAVMKNEIIAEAYEKYNQEFERCKEQFEKNKEMFDEVNLIFSVIEPKHKHIGSGIATQFSTKNPDKIIILLSKIDKGYKVNGRYQEGKVHMGELVKKCTKGIGFGGGHRNAAGGIIDFDSVDAFKKHVVEELKHGFPT